jgi:pilus assembly protein CpaF
MASFTDKTNVLESDQWTRRDLKPKAYQEMKSSIHRNLLNLIDLEKLNYLDDQRARSQILAVIQDLVSHSNTPLSAGERERLSREVLDEVFGLGPLEPLLQDPTISDILVNTYANVYVERAGMLEETNVVFKDNVHLMHAWTNPRPW